MTTQSFDLELIPRGVAPVIYASQYDKGQTWLISLKANNQPFNIPSGASVTIRGTKPDSTGFEYPCTYSGNIVTAEEQQQMTIKAGKVPCEIVISKSGAIIASLNFYLIVEAAALRDDTVISETDLPLIEQAAEAVERIPGMVDAAEQEIENATQAAKGEVEAAAGEAEEALQHYVDEAEASSEDAEAYALGTRQGVPVGPTDPAYENNAQYYCNNSAGGITNAQWTQITALYN